MGTGDAALGGGGSGGLEDSSTNTVFDIKSSSSLSLPESIIYSGLAAPVEVARSRVCVIGLVLLTIFRYKKGL